MEKERGGKPNLLQARLPGAEHRSRDSQERAQKEEQVTLRYTTFRKKSYIRLDWNTAKEYYFRSMAKGLKLLVYCSSSSKLHHDTVSFTYLPLKRLKIAAQCWVLTCTGLCRDFVNHCSMHVRVRDGVVTIPLIYAYELDIRVYLVPWFIFYMVHPTT